MGKSKGGRTSTTWEKGSKWNQGKTQTIRVPIAITKQILQYAHTIDSGIEPDQQLILRAIDSFVESRVGEFHPNQHSRIASTNSRRWDELRRFRNAIASGDSSRSELTFQSLVVTARS
ncbi:MAG: hypothetical protein HWQ41_19295 [Nostoc sp. NOS(2021)]|uniref:hypothetical protein n=1 Tax=Nostoc sp. NOS(2021) TaxID=2815407 RepID=UPI0025EF92C0|nr:hypothetical protein [Nostoc sp. NOS(2021)]MBN3897341.1 hypothetical protein [Nostoc sp. NOS(2021)]